MNSNNRFSTANGEGQLRTLIINDLSMLQRKSKNCQSVVINPYIPLAVKMWLPFSRRKSVGERQKITTVKIQKIERRNMKNLKVFLLTIALISARFAYGDMANGTYNYSPSGSTPIWDISGDYSGSLDGIDLDFSISQESSGVFQGSGSFSYFGGWTDVDISGDISCVGTVSGSAADPSVSMELLITGSGTVEGDDVNFTETAHIKLALDASEGELAASGGSVSVTVTDLTSGKKASRSEPLGKGDTLPLPSDSTGDWNLTLNLTPEGTKYTGTATIVTSTGGTMEFTATGTYSSKTDTSSITLKGEGGELSAVISTSGGQNLTVNSMKGKVYGQTMNFKAP